MLHRIDAMLLAETSEGWFLPDVGLGQELWVAQATEI